MPVGTFYADVGNKLKEDVLDLIFRQVPDDTPLFQMTGDSEAMQPYHQWLIESLTVRSDNAVTEGAAYGFTAEPIGAARELNISQILTKEIRVSRSSQKSARYGVGSQYADQVMKRLIEHKTDMEHALIRGSLASGNASTARRMRGLIFALTLGSLQHTLLGVTSFSEANLNDLLQALWNRAADPRDLLVGGTMARRLSGFTASNTKFRDQNDLKLVNVVAVYQSDFSEVRRQLSRDVPESGGASADTYVIAIDREKFKKAWLDRPFVKRTSDVADSLDGVAIAELTLEYGNPSSGGWVRGTL